MWDLTTIQMNNLCAMRGAPEPTCSTSHKVASNWLHWRSAMTAPNTLTTPVVLLELESYQTGYEFDLYRGFPRSPFRMTWYRDKPKPKGEDMLIRVLIVHPDGTLQVTTIDNDLGPLQQAVGGFIESIGQTDHAICWVDEDGKNKRLQPNPLARAILQSVFGRELARDYVSGRMVITGKTGAECSPVPDKLLNTINTLGTMKWHFGNSMDV